MKTKKIAFLFLTGLCCLTTGFSQITGQWRGENRNGIYHGINLMDHWPESGPLMLWSVENIGNGYSSPVVSGDKVIVNGEINGTGFIYAFNLQGKLLWKTPYGLEYPVNDTSSEQFPGPRSTPTIAGDQIYFCSGLGKMYCFDIQNGTEDWTIDLVSEFDGLIPEAGFSESLLIDGDIIYCYPGGTEKNVAAINRFTGKTIWTARAMRDSASFCSPVLINLPQRKVLVNFTSRYVSGLDAGTGELLCWQKLNNLKYNIQYSSPSYDGENIYYVSALNGYAIKLQLSEDGKHIKEIWHTGNTRSGLHSPVKVNDVLYYSDDRQKIRGIDVNSGKVVDSLRVFRGPVLVADNMLFCYSENGTVSLIKFEDSKMDLVSSFKIEKGTREHLTLPFIDKGVMYIRHGDALMAYDISND